MALRVVLAALALRGAAALALAPRMSISKAAPSARTKRYDYIIVGGGTAGCVLANRLTEEELGRVLLLEAGGAPRGVEVAAPAALTKLFNSRFDWAHETEAEAGAAQRSIFLCRGKALGGSSNTNALLYNRGAPGDFAAWEAKGGRDWALEKLMVHYRAHEDFEKGANAFHGHGGPVRVSTSPYQNPLSRAFLAACHKLGFPANDDFDAFDKPQEGCGRFRITARGGRRVSAHGAYLTPALRRPQLEVCSGTTATRILFEKDRAVGVEFVVSSTGERSIAYLEHGARAEVLLAGGAIASPQLLMLSGVGPAEHLEEHGIPVVVDHPKVGQGLRDQPACSIAYNIQDAASITDHLFRPNSGKVRPLTLLNFLVRGKGALTSPGCDHGGFFYTEDARRGAGEDPDLQLRFVPGRGDSPDGVKSYENLGKGGHVASGVTFQCIAARPKATGEVRLRNGDPFSKPRVRTNFLDNPEDLRTLREGMRLSERIAKEGSVDAASGGLGHRVFPSDIFGPLKGQDIASAPDELLNTYIRETVHSANAVVGTCALGDVVDGQLRVKGVANLRVVDASIMPSLPGGQACSHVYMLAEKAAIMVSRASREGTEAAAAAKRKPLRTVELTDPVGAKTANQEK